MAEILASTDDVNSHLPGSETGGSTSEYPTVVEATEENTHLAQISVARVVRAYLSRTVESTLLLSWNLSGSPVVVPPDPVREAAAMLIAAEHYFNETSRTNLTVDERNFAQLLYDRAMDILNKIIAGEIILGPEVPVTTPALSILDFHPIDDTDRAFTMGMQI